MSRDHDLIMTISSFSHFVDFSQAFCFYHFHLCHAIILLAFIASIVILAFNAAIVIILAFIAAIVIILACQGYEDGATMVYKEIDALKFIKRFDQLYLNSMHGICLLLHHSVISPADDDSRFLALVSIRLSMPPLR